VNLGFQPRPASPSSPRNLCVLRASALSFSFPRTVGCELSASSCLSPFPFNFKLSTVDVSPITPFPATLTSLSQIAENAATLSPAFATLTSPVNHNPFVCHSYTKHPGWGVPSSSANSVHPALKIAPCRRPSQQKGLSYGQLSPVSCQPLFSFSPSAATSPCVTALSPTRASSQADQFDTPNSPPASALESTPIQPPVTVASKELAQQLNPLHATLTKNQGGGGQAVQVVLCRVSLLSMSSSLLQLLNVKPLNPPQPQGVNCRLSAPTQDADHEFKMIRWLADPMTTRVPVLIVGAGISGLVCAHALRKSGIDVQIVEASPRPGGVIRSERRGGFLLELGPQSFSGTPQLLDLCRDLDIENELIEAPPHAPRFLLINGQLKPAPLSPPAFFVSSLFSAKTKGSILRDALGHSAPPAADESVAAFTRRKFSAELLDKLVGPFVSGIYAGDPEKLSLRAAFPQLHEAERTTGSIVRGMLRAAKSKPGPKQRPTLKSFRDGNEALIKALATNLGPALRCGVEVTAIQQGGAGIPQSGERFVVDAKVGAASETIIADRLVLAVPTYVAAKFIRPEIASPLGEIEYAPIAVVSLGYHGQDVGHSLEGFGFLIPRSEGLRSLGTVWNSSLFPDRVPQGSVLFTSFIGGATDPQAIALPVEEISAIVHREISKILSIRNQPSFANVEIYQRALPQYNIGHTSRLANLERESSSLLNLKLVGNYLRGPAIGACIEQAFAVADEIRGGVSATSSG
jgi:oxygen-dependent protoporphyrinogen oxidase